jgi:fatty acid desaturase
LAPVRVVYMILFASVSLVDDIWLAMWHTHFVSHPYYAFELESMWLHSHLLIISFLVKKMNKQAVLSALYWSIILLRAHCAFLGFFFRPDSWTYLPAPGPGF